LEFRKSVHTDQLLECYKNKGAGGSATLLKDLKLIKNKYAKESKKYAPCKEYLFYGTVVLTGNRIKQRGMGIRKAPDPDSQISCQRVGV